MWKEQYRLLLDLQRSPANRHPNPKFQLDQLTTTCVALCRQIDPSGEAVLHQSRINMAKRTGRAKAPNTKVVDLSADFRFADAAEYAAVYGHPHPAPGLLPQFVRALPEHARQETKAAEALVRSDGNGAFIAHPGCFTTAVLLAVVPLLARGIALPRFAVTAITGSTGSGRGLSDKTHHPARRSNVAAYSPLTHRHAPEMAALAAFALGAATHAARPEIDFVPLSGPQARGIYASVQGRLAGPLADGSWASAAQIAAELTDFYAGGPFVAVAATPPALTDVVGTNRARIGVACSGGSIALTVAIDNLVKGAAGGGVQWLNRIYGLDETTGLAAASLGWF